MSDTTTEEHRPIAVFSRTLINNILDTIPTDARICYTGQSILAYCPDPTFDWSELDTWQDQTDIDFFAYNSQTLASVTQAFIDAGWKPHTSIDEFKAERIRFHEPKQKFNLQTVGLSKPGLPVVNLTWRKDCGNVVSTIQRFDMDYLMVGMDVKTREFVDLRGPDHRIANVNRLNTKFDVDDVDVMYWIRQFDRVPKGYSRGIDTRPVARTYLRWLEETIERGDRGVGSKTRFYANRMMEQRIQGMIEAGFDEKQAETIYHLFRREDQTWEAMKLNLEEVQRTIHEWLASVEDD